MPIEPADTLAIQKWLRAHHEFRSATSERKRAMAAAGYFDRPFPWEMSTDPQPTNT